MEQMHNIIGISINTYKTAREELSHGHVSKWAWHTLKNPSESFQLVWVLILSQQPSFQVLAALAVGNKRYANYTYLCNHENIII